MTLLAATCDSSSGNYAGAIMIVAFFAAVVILFWIVTKYK